MTRVLIASFAGAVLYFIWGMLAWMALPIHGPTIHKIPQESSLTESLRGRNIETGVYIAPFPEDEAEMSDPESPFVQAHQAGPIYTIMYHKDGLPVMGPKVLVFGFIIDLLGAGIVVCMLHSSLGGCCSNNYFARVGFVAGFGFFVALIGHLSYFNWMSFPLGYTIAFCIDVIIGWTLVGLVVAAIIKPSDGETKLVQVEA